MTKHVVTDEQVGDLERYCDDLVQRVREGTLPPEAVIHNLRDIINGDLGPDPRRLIDCVSPFPDKFEEVVFQQHDDPIEFDPAKVRFHLDDGQKDGHTIIGELLLKKIAHMPVLSVKTLDWLLANPHRIPESWRTDEQGRTRHVLFWGTVYRDDGRGFLAIRSLYSTYEGRWEWAWCNLNCQFGVQYPTAIYER